MFRYCFGSDDEIDSYLNFSLYQKNIQEECKNLCVTIIPFYEKNKKEKIPSKVKWDINTQINVTYSRYEYNRSIDNNQISKNLINFKKWFRDSCKNMKRPKRRLE